MPLFPAPVEQSTSKGTLVQRPRNLIMFVLITDSSRKINRTGPQPHRDDVEQNQGPLAQGGGPNPGRTPSRSGSGTGSRHRLRCPRLVCRVRLYLFLKCSNILPSAYPGASAHAPCFFTVPVAGCCGPLRAGLGVQLSAPQFPPCSLPPAPCSMLPAPQSFHPAV